MSSRIPLKTSRSNYTVVVPLAGVNYQFADIHWNSEDGSGAWYFNLLEEDSTPILAGIKMVLGTPLGRSTHPFFQANLLTLAATSGTEQDPGFSDLGDRVHLIVTNLAEETATESQ
jgi:hypothetical protein